VASTSFFNPASAANPNSLGVDEREIKFLDQYQSSAVRMAGFTCVSSSTNEMDLSHEDIGFQ
jgi:hypothetical protein